MSDQVDIRVDEKKLGSMAQSMEECYRQLSKIRTELEDAHSAMRNVWEDEAALDFSAKFDIGMEKLWDLMVAVENMGGFLKTAEEMYAAAEKQVLSL